MILRSIGPRLAAISCATIAFLAVGSSSAQATATYVYQGNAFDMIEDNDPPAGSYDPSMRVTASITLPAPLEPNLDLEPVTDRILSATLSDGRQTFTDIAAIFSTDASGAITAWGVGNAFVFIPGETREAGTFRNFDGIPPPTRDFGVVGLDIVFGARDRAEVANSPGTWTLVPEPSTAPLLGFALLLLVGARRAKRGTGPRATLSRRA